MFVKLFSLLFKTLFVCLLSLVHLLISSKFSFLLSLYSNDMAPKSRNLKNFSAFIPPFWKKSRYLWHLLSYLRNSYRFRIRFQNGSIWAPLNLRSSNIGYPDIFTWLKIQIFSTLAIFPNFQHNLQTSWHYNKVSRLGLG